MWKKSKENLQKKEKRCLSCPTVLNAVVRKRVGVFVESELGKFLVLCFFF